MLMSTVLAVALGLAPVKEEPAVQIVPVSVSKLVGSYAQRVDRAGTVHLTGFDRVSGRYFRISVEKDGDVSGKIGEQLVSFHVAELG